MFNTVRNKLYSTYLKVVSSIAFYPALIAVGMLFLALALLEFEDTATTKFLLDKFPYLVINDSATARSLLATLIGSILSLTVFSFSMVMVLLNQASSNFSPRLLPGLISDKKNQVVLGVYLGTIVYNIINLMSIQPSGDTYTMNGFSILLGIIFGIVCLGLFVFFIHSISTDIQINNILRKIFEQAKKRLGKLQENERLLADPIKVEASWQTLLAEAAGYYQGVNLEGLRSFAEKHSLQIKILPMKGQYILQNMKIAAYSKSLEDDLKDELKSMIIYGNSHNVNENYVLGINQITEVGVKAMSPGINDPGTAVMTIDYLTELLAMRMRLTENEVYSDANQTYVVELSTVNFKVLIYEVLAAYRQYCKHDIILMKKITQMLLYLQQQSCGEEQYMDVLSDQLQILIADIEQNIANERDRSTLISLIEDQ